MSVPLRRRNRAGGDTTTRNITSVPCHPSTGPTDAYYRPAGPWSNDRPRSRVHGVDEPRGAPRARARRRGGPDGGAERRPQPRTRRLDRRRDALVRLPAAERVPGDGVVQRTGDGVSAARTSPGDASRSAATGLSLCRRVDPRRPVRGHDPPPRRDGPARERPPRAIPDCVGPTRRRGGDSRYPRGPAQAPCRPLREAPRSTDPPAIRSGARSTD